MVDSSGLAIITGSSSGIGRATARALAVRGYRTVLVARRLDLLEELATDLKRYAPSTPVAMDLSGGVGVESAFSQLAQEVGSVDILVNCAGHGVYKRFLDCEPDEHRELMDLHYFAATATIRAVLPDMLSHRRGHIINIGSMSTKMGPWGHSGYAAAKSALTTLTESLAAEYRRSGVHFSIVHPGIVDTPYWHRPTLAPLHRRNARRQITAERVADVVARLVVRPRLQVCVPRHYRVTDALGAVSPALLHRLVAWQSTLPHHN
jgi:short-subunit dehydrogenase